MERLSSSITLFWRVPSLLLIGERGDGVERWDIFTPSEFGLNNRPSDFPKEEYTVRQHRKNTIDHKENQTLRPYTLYPVPNL